MPQLDSGVKRQRSQKEKIPEEKRSRIGGGPPKSFNEVAKQVGSIILGVMGNGKEDGAISREKWERVASAISAAFMRVMRENPGLRTKSYNLVAYSGTGKLRPCLLIRKELNAFILPNFSNEDILTVSLEGPSGKLWLMSACKSALL